MNNEYEWIRLCEPGDMDYILNGLANVDMSRINTDNILIKLFFPQTARLYFDQKADKTPYILIDQLDEKLHGKPLYDAAKQILNESKFPVLIFRKKCNKLYAWDSEESLYDDNRIKTIETWVDENVQQYDEDLLQDQIEKIDKNFGAYDLEFICHSSELTSFQSYIDHATFCILSLIYSKHKTQPGYAKQISSVVKLLYNTLYFCGEEPFGAPDYELPETTCIKLQKSHINNRDIFLEHVKKCLVKLSDATLSRTVINFAIEVWYFRQYHIEGRNEDHFPINVRGEARQLVRKMLNDFVSEIHGDLLKTKRPLPPHRINMLTADELFSRYNHEESEESYEDVMDTFDDVEIEMIMNAAKQNTEQKIDPTVKNFFEFEGKKQNETDKITNFNALMKSILGITDSLE